MKEVNPFDTCAVCLIAWHTECPCPGGAVLCDSAFWNMTNGILSTCKSLPGRARLEEQQAKPALCVPGDPGALPQPLVGRGLGVQGHLNESKAGN